MWRGTLLILACLAVLCGCGPSSTTESLGPIPVTRETLKAGFYRALSSPDPRLNAEALLLFEKKSRKFDGPETIMLLKDFKARDEDAYRAMANRILKAAASVNGEEKPATKARLAAAASFFWQIDGSPTSLGVRSDFLDLIEKDPDLLGSHAWAYARFERDVGQWNRILVDKDYDDVWDELFTAAGVVGIQIDISLAEDVIRRSLKETNENGVGTIWLDGSAPSDVPVAAWSLIAAEDPTRLKQLEDEMNDPAGRIFLSNLWLATGDVDRAEAAFRQTLGPASEKVAPDTIAWQALSIVRRDPTRKARLSRLVEDAFAGTDAVAAFPTLAHLGGEKHLRLAEDTFKAKSRLQELVGPYSYIVSRHSLAAAETLERICPLGKKAGVPAPNIWAMGFNLRGFAGSSDGRVAGSLARRWSRELPRELSVCDKLAVISEANRDGGVELLDLLPAAQREALPQLLARQDPTVGSVLVDPAKLTPCWRRSQAAPPREAVGNPKQAAEVHEAIQACPDDFPAERYVSEILERRLVGEAQTGILSAALPSLVWDSGNSPPVLSDLIDSMPTLAAYDSLRIESSQLYRLTSPLFVPDWTEVDQPIEEDEEYTLYKGAVAWQALTGGRFGDWLDARLANYHQDDRTAANGAVQTYLALWQGASNDGERRRIRAELSSSLGRLCASSRPTEGETTEHQRPWGPFLRVLRPLLQPRATCLNGPGAEAARQLSDQSKGALDGLIPADLKPYTQGGQIGAAAGGLGLTLLLHALVWSVLLVAYPYSPQVQAFVFWNPIARKFGGLGYVQLLLTTVPVFRNRLFAPFRHPLTADGRLTDFRPEAYFQQVHGRHAGVDQAVEGRLVELLPEIRGQIFLQGASGLGKSWFLRDLALRAGSQPLAFLNATSCAGGGVITAIGERCSGMLRDPEFLEQLIYVGGLSVIIDGLNEVQPQVRHDIIAFANLNPAAQIILASQPLKLDKPLKSHTVEILPLAIDQIETFLLGRSVELRHRITDNDLYKRGVSDFVASLGSGRSDAEREALAQVVSNPMDLRSVADIIAADKRPDLFMLQEQLIDLASSDYADANAGAPFPMEAFAEHVYGLRAGDQPMMLGPEEWPRERQALRERRLLVRQDGPDGQDNWRFRHDKISDYLLLQAFEDKPARFEDHIGDSRFIGVYLLLARSLPIDLAQNMLNRLFVADARNDEFVISKAFYDLLDLRLRAQGDRLASETIVPGGARRPTAAGERPEIVG